MITFIPVSKLYVKLALTGLIFLMLSHNSWAERIKDLASVQGIRSNQLVGYGLVVGLTGTGDQTTQTPFTTQSIINMLAQLGTTLPANQPLQLKNVAAVIITANLPPYAKIGQAIDITVSSMGNAKNLKGGTLVMTPLKGADGQIYAQAQGNVSGDSSSARILAGALVEKEVQTEIGTTGTINYLMNQTDYGTTQRAVDAINRELGQDTAKAIDGRLFQVTLPENQDARVSFMGQIENLDIRPMLAIAKVVINSHTGTVVMNQTVTLSACAVSHGTLAVTVSPDINNNTLISVKEGVTLTSIVKAINSLGATPSELISILQAMKTAGVLQAELEIM